MAEDAGMLAEALAVVGGDDHPGRFEDRTSTELVEQSAQLFIEVRDAVIVGVAGKRDIPRRDRRLVHRPPSLDHVAVAGVDGPVPRSGGSFPAGRSYGEWAS